MSDQTDFEENDIDLPENGALVVGVAFIIGGSIGAITDPSNAFGAFLTLGAVFAGIAWIGGTKSGRQFVKNAVEAQQQHQQVAGKKNDGPQRACPHCGWQNPAKNNYCHDCGGRFDRKESKSSGTESLPELRRKYNEGEISGKEVDERIREIIDAQNK